jgi:hypothetical protein
MEKRKLSRAHLRETRRDTVDPRGPANQCHCQHRCGEAGRSRGLRRASMALNHRTRGRHLSGIANCSRPRPRAAAAPARSGSVSPTNQATNGGSCLLLLLAPHQCEGQLTPSRPDRFSHGQLNAREQGFSTAAPLIASISWYKQSAGWRLSEGCTVVGRNAESWGMRRREMLPD